MSLNISRCDTSYRDGFALLYITLSVAFADCGFGIQSLFSRWVAAYSKKITGVWCAHCCEFEDDDS